jgi:hypothetical protein
MDPEATLTHLADCFRADKRDVARIHELLAAYYSWRSGSGFEPTNGDERAARFVIRLPELANADGEAALVDLREILSNRQDEEHLVDIINQGLGRIARRKIIEREFRHANDVAPEVPVEVLVSTQGMIVVICAGSIYLHDARMHTKGFYFRAMEYALTSCVAFSTPADWDSVEATAEFRATS